MSLSAALSTAVSGLTAQSRALSAISENIANSSTTAYKTTDVYFQALVSGGKGSATSTSAVTAKSSQAMSVQGTVTSTSVATNVAIQDAGFFVVTSDPAGAASADMYTRNGSFETNADGYLINTEGFYLMGWPTDAEGNVLASNTNDLTGLSAINLSSIGGTAKATTEIEMSANVPADADVGAELTTSMQMIDSLGVSHTVGQTWTKTADNTWTLELSDPVLTSDGTTKSGDMTAGGPYTVTFNTDGSLASISPALSFTVENFTTGAADSTVTMDIGEVGGTDGVTQYASTSSVIGLEDVQTEQDGALYGELSDIEIDSEGLVTANFDNGISLAIYQIPIATFSNPNGLTLVSGTTYDENSAAGQVHLNLPGEGGAGTLVASALEGSTTDIATEFNKMIIAQQAYSAASQVVSSAGDMFDSLIQAVR
jgi:flagellar hook protein FlgE